MRSDTIMNELFGQNAWRVGGSVRDELLGREPKDADYVVTNVSLHDMGDILGAAGYKPSKLQLRNGTIVGWRCAMPEVGLVEICLPRTEVSTGPGHGDYEIVASPDISLDADASRRDFTINAIYRNCCTNEIRDPFHGQVDLSTKRIRVLNRGSFEDDPLRILRGLRFMSTLGFDIDYLTEMFMTLNHYKVTGLTRVGVSGTGLDELCRLLMGVQPAEALRTMRNTGVMKVFLPELAPMIGFAQESKYHDMTVDEHTFEAIQIAADMNASLRVRMALLFHDSGKPEVAWRGEDGRLHYYARDDNGEDHEVASMRIVEATLRRLNAPNSLLFDVRDLIKYHMVGGNKTSKWSRMMRLRHLLGHDLAIDLIRHSICDASAKGEPNPEIIRQRRQCIELIEQAKEQDVPEFITDLNVNGTDIKALGAEGKAIGIILRQLMDEVLCDPSRNDRDWLIRRAGKISRTIKKEMT